MVRKTLSLLLGFFLVFMLAACNEVAEPVESSDEESSTKSESEQVAEESSASDLTLSELLEKSTAASDELESFKMMMDLQQEMSGVEEMNTSANIEMKVITEPMQLYQKMNMEIADTPENVETETYFTQEGIFMKMPGGETSWMKFPEEMSEQILQSSPQQSNPAEEMKKLQQYVDDFTFEQDQNSFILNLKASGDEFNEFINDILGQTFTSDMMGEGNLSMDMVINELNYEVFIDKETFYPSKMNVYMDMEMTVEGETVHLIQDMSGEYSDFNAIDEIKIPQEALDNAIDLNMDMESNQ